MNSILPLLLLTVLLLAACKSKEVPQIAAPEAVYTMPDEEQPHEGTWLQWPHNYGYDVNHVARYEASWVAMARALHTGERVHIVVYDATERARVTDLLTSEGLDMGQIDFFTWKTDDVWVRDNGPIFVFDAQRQLTVGNWEFNGWGNKTPYQNCNQIPVKVSSALGLPRVDVPMVNEGGSVEVDGNGTLMAKRSSILNRNRNPGWKQKDAEKYFRKYLGVTNFIWLDGARGLDITDDHIDGTARFARGNTIVTLSRDEGDAREYDLLAAARNAQGAPYQIRTLPLTQNKIPGLDERGIYLNYYVGNTVVLVPNYDDPMDATANAILQDLYPNRSVVGISAAELAKDGGMVHCVTQQQPMR